MKNILIKLKQKLIFVFKIKIFLLVSSAVIVYICC